MQISISKHLKKSKIRAHCCATLKFLLSQMLDPPCKFTLVLPINSYPWPVSSPATWQDRADRDGCDINGKWSRGDATPQSNSGICHCPGHADWASLAHWLRLMMTVALSLSPCASVSKHDSSHIKHTLIRDTTRPPTCKYWLPSHHYHTTCGRIDWFQLKNVKKDSFIALKVFYE